MAKIDATIVVEMDWDTKSEFAEACARDGKAKALAAGDNELARHFSLRVAEIMHQRAWVAELAAKAGVDGTYNECSLCGFAREVHGCDEITCRGFHNKKITAGTAVPHSLEDAEWAER